MGSAASDAKRASSVDRTSDGQARRLVGLMVSFSNARHPLSSELIRADHYPELTTASFLRQFSRDRQRLAEAGLVISRTRRGKEEATWYAEETSFADLASLDAADALMLDVLCAPLASDPSFARHEELRHALAKLDGAFGEVTAARVARGAELPALESLLDCLERRVVAQVRYVDARGQRSERAYAPFGTFGLRGHTYVVCALVGADGAVLEHGLRSLRDDRLLRVKASRQQYEIPADFCADDLRVLPFQIGPTVGVARFRVVDGSSQSAANELRRHALPPAGTAHSPSRDDALGSSANNSTYTSSTAASTHDAPRNHGEDDPLAASAALDPSRDGVPGVSTSGSAGAAPTSVNTHSSSRDHGSAYESSSAARAHGVPHDHGEGDPLPTGATHSPSRDDSYNVEMSDVEDAAAWAIASGLVPLSPPELVHAWSRRLARAQETQARPIEGRPAHGRATASSPEPDVKGRALVGRPLQDAQTRELLALVGALREQGSTLTVDAVSARLGITRERAHELLMLVLTTGTGYSSQLPLGINDSEDELVLCFARGVRGRPLRFTQSEAVAFDEALDQLGFAPDEPLREEVHAAFGPVGTQPMSASTAQARISPLLGEEENERLEACSRALIDDAGLCFAYQGGSADAPERRSVRPLALRTDGGHWYLDSYDLDRHARRTFRIDRMADLRVTATDGEDDRFDAPTQTRSVWLAFSDEHLLELLEWPQLVVRSRKDAVIATIPYYGGVWLARRVAALGGTVATDDEELAAAVRAEASRQQAVVGLS